MLVTGLTNYLRASLAYRDSLHVHFEDLQNRRRLIFDCALIDHIDEPAVEGYFHPLHDVTGSIRFEPRYENRPPPPGRSWLPPVLDLDQEAVILGKSGWIVTQQGWLRAASYLRGQSFLPRSLQTAADTFFLLKRTVRLRGRTLNVVSDFASHVYGHALWESVYRVLLYWDRHQSFDAVDHVVATPLAVRLLNRFRPEIAEHLAPKLFTDFDKYTKIICDTVVAMPHPVTATAITQVQAEILNRYVTITETALAGEKLFLKRGVGGRSIGNMNEVMRVVEGCGYRAIEAGRTPDIYSVFRHARSIVGVHGSDLADVIFMTQGAHVLELTPTAHVQGYFRAAGRSRDLRYDTLFCASRTHRMRGDRQSRVPVTVDCAALEQALAGS